MKLRLMTFLALCLVLLACALTNVLFPERLANAQAKPAQNSAAPAAAKSSAPRAVSDLNQLMRSILFNNANVIFFAQNEDPAAVKRDAKPSGATDPLAGVYGGWAAEENSAMALAEAANLLNLPDRMCSNGKTAPVNDPEWQKYVEGLRAAGLAAYQAAQTKNMDKMLDASDQVGTACLNCHDRFRQRTRCE